MSEEAGTYTIQEPTLTEQVQALQREVQHVTEQLTVEHGQIAYWKARAQTAEQALERLQTASGRTHGKTGLSTKGHASDRLHGQAEPKDGLL